jgi:hypothetical protein
VTRVVLALLATLAVSACVVPSEPSKQAEEIASIAAEGSLLAGDAADGDTTSAFTRVHANALRKNLGTLKPEVEAATLTQLLREADAALTQLAAAPSDEARAARLGHRLDQISGRAEELAR